MSRKAKPTEAAPPPRLESIVAARRDVVDQQKRVDICKQDWKTADAELRRRERLLESLLDEDLPLFEEPSKPPQKSE